METQEQRVMILHGFSREELYMAIRAVKTVLPDADVAFAKSTGHSLKRTLGELVDEIAEDHAYMKANPPDQE
ncbi:MAG: DUF3783 domain-containing protein [Sphaerochaeta sp.]|nr:MAG: DUF3783 domain-containing protein [Sphaerochaeta sp.]